MVEDEEPALSQHGVDRQRQQDRSQVSFDEITRTEDSGTQRASNGELRNAGTFLEGSIRGLVTIQQRKAPAIAPTGLHEASWVQWIS